MLSIGTNLRYRVTKLNIIGIMNNICFRLVLIMRNRGVTFVDIYINFLLVKLLVGVFYCEVYHHFVGAKVRAIFI